MGGAGGHMNHPHDLDHVKNGKDFINFFTTELPDILFGSTIGASSGFSNPNFTVKLDGVNAAIKFHIQDIELPNGNHDIDIKAAIQRGTLGDITDPHYNSLTRFKESETGKPHGMVPVYNDLLDIANKAINLTLLEIKSKGLGVEKFFKDLATRNSPAVEGESNIYYDIIFDIEAIYPNVKNLIDYDNFRNSVNAEKIFVLNGIKKLKLIQKKEKSLTKTGKVSEKVVSSQEEEYLDPDELIRDKSSAARLLYDNLVDIAKKNNIIFKRRIQAEFLLSDLSDNMAVNELEIIKRKRNILIREVNDVLNETITFGDGDSDTIRNFILKLDKLLGNTSIYKLNNDNDMEIRIVKNGVESKRPLRFMNKETFYSAIYLNKINMLEDEELRFSSDISLEDQKKTFEILKSCAIIWESERRLGNLYLKFFSGKLIKPNGSEENFDIHSDNFQHEGVVIEVNKNTVDLPNQHLRFKLTGEFIVSGMMSQFKK